MMGFLFGEVSIRLKTLNQPYPTHGVEVSTFPRLLASQ